MARAALVAGALLLALVSSVAADRKCGANDFAPYSFINVTALKPAYRCVPSCTNHNVCDPETCCDDVSKNEDQMWQYCLPNLAEDCGDPVNYACEKCSLYFIATNPRGSCDSSSTNNLCKVVQQTGPDLTIQIGNQDAGSKIAHWKAVPKRAIRGMEEISTNNNVPDWQDNLWSNTWKQLATAALPFGANQAALTPAKVNPEEMGMHINAAWVRQYHQLHIHLGHRNNVLQRSMQSDASKKFGVKFLEPNKPELIEDGCYRKAAVLVPSNKIADVNPFTEYSKIVGSNLWPRTLTCGYQDKFKNKARYYTSIMMVKANSPWMCKYGSGAATTCDKGFIVFLMADMGDDQTLFYKSL